MDKKHLAITISKLEGLEIPVASLEQYQTPSELAASILWIAQPDIHDKTVADFGTGNGIFAIGAALLGAKKVYAVDIDADAIRVARRNAERLGIKIEFICKDVKEFFENVDTVIQNPPFGVQEEHADKQFLEKAMELSDNIYTIHKIESKPFIEKFSKDMGFKTRLIDVIEFPIKATMRFHEKDVYKVKVGVWKLTRK
jgi:putative methylase